MTWSGSLCQARVMSRSLSAPLSGWYVISLRPPGQHGPIRRAAAAQGADLVATAHTADDQAETFLLRLLRGEPIHATEGVAP